MVFAGEATRTPGWAAGLARHTLGLTRLDPVGLLPGRLPSADVTLVWHEKMALAAAPRPGRPVVAGLIWLTDDDHGLPAPALALARRAYRRAAGDLRAQPGPGPVLVDDWGLDARAVHHVLMGVDTDFWTPGPPTRRAGVITVGNDRHRDHAAVGDALDRLSGTVSDVAWTLCSSLPLERPSPTLVEHSVVGHPELRDRYRKAAVLVLGLRHNLHVSGVTALLEAMACGTPVVATATPGLEDYVEEGVTGYLVDPGDVEAMAERTAGLLRDPARAHDMGQRARAAVLERFSSVTMGRALAEVVRSVLPDRPSEP